MGGKVISLLLTPVFIGQVFSLNLHPAVSQYLQLAGLATPSQPVVKVPAPKPSPAASFQTIAALASLLANPPCSKSNPVHVPEPKPAHIISPQPADLAKAVTPSLVSSLPPELTKSLPPSAISTLTEYLNAFAKPEASNPKSPAVTSLETLYSSFPTLDPSFLNSLVLAIQLLLLTNILNSSVENALETNTPTYQYEKESPTSVVVPSTQPQTNFYSSATSSYYPYYESPSYSVPNAKFLGTSTFMDSNPIMSSISYPSSSRNGLALMSPYEALGPTSSYPDPILSSSYGSNTMNLKRDFQSPYMAILASEPKEPFNFNYNDLFS